jgi:hypothetical protein
MPKNDMDLFLRPDDGSIEPKHVTALNVIVLCMEKALRILTEQKFDDI